MGVAHIAEAEAAQIKFMTVIDTGLPTDQTRTMFHAELKKLKSILEEVELLPKPKTEPIVGPKALVNKLNELELNEQVKLLGRGEIESLLWINCASMEGLSNYEPKRIQCPVKVFEATDGVWRSHLMKLWGSFVANNLTVSSVKGDHVSVMQPGNISPIAIDILNEFAESVNTRPRHLGET